MKLAEGAGLIAAAALAVGGAWLSFPPLPARTPTPAEGEAGPGFGASEGAAASVAQLALPVAKAEAAKPLPSPGKRVEALALSGDAHDAFQAFQLIDHCTRARAAEGGSALEAACRGITATQLRQRLALLEAAVRAGVSGATTAWTGEGPFGDKTALTQRPDDPLVIEWVREAVAMIRTAAGRDDVAAITQLGWLTVHWNMSDTERLSALVNHPAEWAPNTPVPAASCQEPAPCR